MIEDSAIPVQTKPMLDEAKLKEMEPPKGWDKERWQKHAENSCRAEKLTGLVPFNGDGWEKIAVLLMDRLEASVQITEADVRRAVGELFMSGARKKADRLVLFLDDGRDLGGWREPFMADRLCDLLGLKETPNAQT